MFNKVWNMSSHFIKYSTLNEMKLVLEFKKPKGLWDLKVY